MFYKLLQLNWTEIPLTDLIRLVLFKINNNALYSRVCLGPFLLKRAAAAL